LAPLLITPANPLQTAMKLYGTTPDQGRDRAATKNQQKEAGALPVRALAGLFGGRCDFQALWGYRRK
jgi:hypothetical protein